MIKAVRPENLYQVKKMDENKRFYFLQAREEELWAPLMTGTRTRRLGWEWQSSTRPSRFKAEQLINYMQVLFTDSPASPLIYSLSSTASTPSLTCQPAVLQTFHCCASLYLCHASTIGSTSVSSSSALWQGAATPPPVPLTYFDHEWPCCSWWCLGDAPWDSDFLPLMSSLGRIDLLILKKMIVNSMPPRLNVIYRFSNVTISK